MLIKKLINNSKINKQHKLRNYYGSKILLKNQKMMRKNWLMITKIINKRNYKNI